MSIKNIIKTHQILFLFFAYMISGCGELSSRTVTEEATVTQEPAMTITPTLDIQPTATVRSISTLTSDERMLQVKEWLATNADCRLPCWWGIEPGKTTPNELSDFLDRVGAKSSAYEEGEVVLHYTAGFDLDQEHISNTIAFQEKDEMIIAIVIDAHGSNDSPDFKDTWTSFSPEQIMAEYGVPSRVWVWARSSVHEGSPGPTMPYSIWFFYDLQGILVRYSGQVHYDNIYKMCPLFHNQGNLSDDIDIYLQTPEANTPLEDLPTVKNNTNDAISLEDAAGISLNKFYELFTKPGVEPCFETPQSIWP